MRSPLTRITGATLIGIALTGFPATAGIELLTEPSPPSDQINLDMEEYVPFSGTSARLSDEEQSAAVFACDEQAAHPGNDENPDDIEGVTYDKIDGSKALPACLAAVAAVPDSKRMRYQLARAKQASGQGRDAIKDLTELANKGYVPAINNLGATYQIGIGVRRDYTKAVKWYEKAANENFVPSMAILGWLHHMGLGTPKDSEKAIEWYRKASDGGSASAMHNLGHMYHNGWGTDADPVKAADWFRQSAEGGFGQGMAMTAWTYQVGRGVEVDAERAIEWYEKAAEIGEFSAMSGLATFYDVGGSGIARQPKKAAQWFLRAVMEGHAPTKTRLTDQSETLQPETRRAIQAQLNALGFDPGVADGVFGQKTIDALEEAFNTP